MTETTFRMHGAREILLLSAGGVAIERHVEALENSVENNPGLAFDLARSLVEGVCKTILADRGRDPGNTGFKDLLQDTYKVVRLVPESYSTKQEVVDSIQKILAGFENVIQGLTNLRHSEGMASHGKDAYAVQLETVQARLAAQSADVVVHYLYMAHKNYQIPAQVPQLRYDDNPKFNSYVDESHEPVRIFELTYQPSEVLFNTDEDAYRSLLSEFASEKERNEE